MTLVRRLSGFFVLSLLVSCLNIASSPPWPAPAASRALELSFQSSAAGDVDLVRDLPVCVGSQSWSAGELGRSILYRYQRDGRTLKVGYFVYWSTERPWGKNLLSYSILPALFIDAFYSHALFLFPGAQRFIHGPGDIEGARVVYEQNDDGRWTPVSAVADDGFHHEVPLSPDDFVDADGRVVLMTDVWSHQLGAKGSRVFSATQKDALVCFDRNSIEPLTAEIARLFRLGSPSDPRRAPPAWKLGPPTVSVAMNPSSPLTNRAAPFP